MCGAQPWEFRTDGSLLFVVGASMSVKTLGNIVHDARAARAMELDFNQSLTNVITYTYAGNGVAVPQMLPQNAAPERAPEPLPLPTTVISRLRCCPCSLMSPA
jgi:hypothetical protein